MAIVTTNQNLTAVSYAAGEIIEIRNGAVLTIDSTPATRPGTIQCITSGKLCIENNSTTTPIVLTLEDQNRDLRFEGNGILEIRGNSIEIGTGTGASQTFDFATLFSGALTDITYVEVETASGSGVYVPWHIIDVTPQYYNAINVLNLAPQGSFVATEVDGTQPVFFWDSLLRTLTSGNGTNGLSVPSGCKIRIPNILITNQDWWPDATLITGIASLGTPTGGTFTITLINRRTSTTIGTTAAIAHNAAATAVRDAVIAVLGAGTVTSAGGPLPTTVTLTLAGAFVSTPIAMLVTSSVTGGTNASIYSRESSTSNMSLLDLNPSGTLDAESAMFSQKIFTANSSFSSAVCKQVGFGGSSLQFTNSNGRVELDCVSVKANPHVLQTATSVSNVSGPNTKINKLVISGGTPAHIISTIPNLTQCDDVRVLCYVMRQSTTVINAFSINTIPNVPIIRPRIVGGALRLTNLVGNVVSNFTHADRPLTQTTVNPAVACSMINCIDVTLAYTGKAGVAAARSAIFSTDAACSNVLIVGGSYDGTNFSAGVVGQHLGAVFEVRNFTVTNQRTATQSFDAPSSFACTGMSGSKVFTGGGQATLPTLDSNQNGQYDLVGCDLQSLVQANLSVENFVGGNFMDLGVAPTTGHVSFFGFGSGQGMSLTGSSFTDQIGSVFLPTNGDTAEITIPFAMHGITSFQNLAPRFDGECPGGFARVGRVINDGGVTGGTFTIAIYDETNTIIGTTDNIAHNASTSAVDAAIELVTGAGSVTVSGTLTAGYVITFLTGVIRRLEGNGTNLTGGTKAGTMDSYAIYTRTEANEVFPGIEFACRVPGTAYPAYQTLNGTNLSGAIAALTGYDEGGSGLEMRIKVTATGDAGLRRLRQCSIFTNIDPDAWDVFDSSITFNGPNPTDVIRIRRLSDLGEDPPVNLYSFTGGGQHDFNVGANFGEEVFFVREDSTGVVLMRSLPSTQNLGYGNLGEVNLFYGEEVQLAQSSDVAAIKAAVELYLDVAISSRLATAGYSAPANSDITAILADTNELQTNQNNWLTATGFATPTDVTNAQTAIITQVDANETKIDIIDTVVDGIASSVAALNDFDPATEQVIVATNNDKTGYSLANNSITSSVISNNAFGNSAFTNGYFNSINAEVDTALADYDGPTKAELDLAEADIIAALPAAAPSASTVASAVRTELTTELGRVDVAISTRLATSGYTAPANSDITAIKTKTDQLTFTIANQVDSNSLSGGGGLDAAGVRSAIGLASANLDTQLSTIDTVVDAIKVKTDNLPTDPADESSIQAAIAAIPAAPSASSVASAVRTELTTELGRVDVAVSTRLATAGYTAPANADIAAILVDTGTTIPAQISGLNDISASEVNAEVDAALADYDGPTKAELDSAQSSIETDVAANLTAIGVVNEGVKKASLLIPHSEDI